MRRPFRWVAWLIYSGIVTGIGIEVLVRLLLPQVLPLDAPQIYRPDDTIGWRRTPNVRALANTGDRDVMICTDDRGDRVSCTAPRPAECVRRVLVVGDSFVEALAVPFEETAWALLQSDTSACVDVAGVGGYEPSQYLQLVRERLGAGGPRYDLVIASLFVGNDFITDAEKIPPAQSVWAEPIRLLPERLDADALVRWLHPFDQWLESRSHAYVAMRFAIRNARDPGDVGIYGLPLAVVRDRLTPSIVDATCRSFALMAEAASRAEASMLITIVPARVQVLDADGSRLEKIFPALAGSIDMDLVTNSVAPRLAHLAGVSGVVDLLPVLRAHPAPEYWGVRDQHFGSRGHAAWFAALRDTVRTNLGLPAS
jgi:hypothetical protein